MNPDYTQQQSLGGLQKAERLSLQSTVPPAEISGYKIERLLGQGAFGQVWMGRDLNTRRQVAIKFYLHRGGVNWSLLSQEVGHLVNMSTGRYVVQILAVGWEAEPPYYVMELLENGSLEDLVRSRGSLGISETVSILREIADGLSFAHSKGILHCDLKPANVLLDHDWRPRLADFGQSRMTHDQTPSLGTLFFMAPEQADLKASPDAAWDVYALGAIAYTMLVGSPPYRTPEVVETLDTANSLPERLTRYRDTIRKAPRPRLHYRRRGIDKGLCQIVDRCLAVRPEQRFSNLQQVIGAIDARNRSRIRRPLYIMGLVGPIVLTLLMLFFSARGISLAKQQSLKQVQEISLASNQETAYFAKRTMESEIESLFDLVVKETERSELHELLSRISDSQASLLNQLADGKPHPEVRKQFIADIERKHVDEYLKRRIDAMVLEDAGGAGVAIFNSILLTEHRGVNVGIAFSDPSEEVGEIPVGRSFAFRSYFNGLREDGDKSLPPHDYQPLRYPHLSASFRSTTTGQWKMGISAPVWSDADSNNGRNQERDVNQQPVGVLVLTVNLGDFVLLSDVLTDEAQRDARFTILVDGRAGPQQGTLLQHPLIQSMDRETMLRATIPQISRPQLERLQSSVGILDYQDPAVSLDGGDKYAGNWIAAMAQVQLPNAARAQSHAVAGERLKSDLWVLSQVRGSLVTQPVTELGSTLQRETYIELAALLTVVIVLWYFVFRMAQSPLGRIDGIGGGNLFGNSLTTGGSGSSGRAAPSPYQSTVDSDR
jgi:serine/threonine protein kinase